MSTLKLGVMASLPAGPEAEMQKAHELGLPTCQLVCWQRELFSAAMADRVVAASRRYGVEVTTLWTGLPGPAVWNFTEGPATIGLVPPERRAERVATLKEGADFAVRIGVSSITTHVGFIPENPGDPLYPGLLEALKDVVAYCRARSLTFCFETGQETPVTLLRVIEDLGRDGLGINLDPANLLLYGKANPVDALDVIGAFVRGVHAKDGEYPTNGRYLGEEKALGQGRVNFPVLAPKLKALGYSGALTIEREISGPQQIADIRRAIELLTPLL
ncbi:MAG: sugar phosphate isomerase/epimerase [Chloroflexi bacterium]|nr:sugar phosphate isomerase/epimerase [Chloroflexota bacterium]